MIPLVAPLFNGNEKKYVDECLSTGAVTADGAFGERLEAAAAAYCGRKFAVAVCNGTAAVETALYAAGVRPGHRVVLSTLSPIAPALATIRLGAVPLLLDIDPVTWTLDSGTAARYLARGDESTRAVLPTAIFGHPVHLDPLLEVCAQHRVAVVENVAFAAGAEYASHYLAVGSDAPLWKRCGAFGKVSALSLGAGAAVTAGEGGLVLTDSEEAAVRARGYRNFCGDETADCGYNFRLANIPAALGLAQWEQIDDLVARKRQVAAWYGEFLQDVPELRLQAVMPWAHPVFAAVAVEIRPENGKKAAAVIADLRTHQIVASPFGGGLHTKPALRYLVEIIDGGCPHADTLSDYGLCLPSSPMLTVAQVRMICEVLKNIVVRK